MSTTQQTMDGNEAAAYISYAFTEVAGIYPITPSSNMAEHVDEWAADGRHNLFGQPVRVVEMQSEAGAAGAVHGSLSAGALTTTYTASQGLLLMIPNMYKIAGELLPAVFHVSARAVAGHALSIFGDHSDVMACRQTGFALLASGSVQQVMDLGAVAHLCAIKGRVPFLHFFDGFRTSHEMQKIDVLSYHDLSRLLDEQAVRRFRQNALNPEHPVLRGTAQNPDIFFQAKEAANPFYDRLPALVDDCMKQINRLTGRDLRLFNYYGHPRAKRVIVAMGSVCDALEETADYLNQQGQEVGLINVHLYRPFSAAHFFDAVPDTVQAIAVLDRVKEPGAPGEPLYLDVCAAFAERSEPTACRIVGGRYGLGSKDVFPSQLVAVYDNLKSNSPRNHFTVGICDDVTHLSLAVGEYADTATPDTFCAKLWGIGSDGTVGANKNTVKIIGEHTDLYAQAYFSYDSKKSGGVTQSHLRFAKAPIRSSYLIKTADFAACHSPSYLDKYDMLSDLKPGGTFLLNCLWPEGELADRLPAAVKREIARKGIRLYIIDGVGIARDLGLGGRINSILQAAFFKLTGIIPLDDAVAHMKAAVQATYGRKGEAVVRMNHEAIDAGVTQVKAVRVPSDWAAASDPPAQKTADTPAFVRDIAMPINALKGDLLPVSAFAGREDGTFPQGTAAYEKRGVAVDIPEWLEQNCIQCNLCAYVCPHATVRPFLLTDAEKTNAPHDMATLAAKGLGAARYHFRIQVSPLDCYGCGVCAVVCPPKEKALVMRPIAQLPHEADRWQYCVGLPAKPNPLDKHTVKGSQFETPLLEFSGACAGCGETPYAKLITQLFGDRLYIGNATGCSSIWGGSAPSTPYCLDEKGRGPAWCNSLFEDTAEFSLGLQLAITKRRDKLGEAVSRLAEAAQGTLRQAAKDWLAAMHDGEASREASEALREAIAAHEATDGKADEALAAPLAHIKENDDMLVKKSVWAFGGDGWAYDIGFGGVDHVLASGEDVNLLVMDTEVYSNTGGQASKATPYAAVAKFAAAGMTTAKKDLGLMAITYGNAYVAQIAMGADYAQTLKAIREAEAHPGPSLVIAYATCINHGIQGGMANAQLQMKRAVACGYWHLYRYNPRLQSPFVMDSKPPTESLSDFLHSEMRYTILKQSYPEAARRLFAQAEADAKRRMEGYARL